MSQLILPLGSNPRHTFATFSADTCPSVVTALERLPEQGGLMLLTGPTGCGKSHLLEASAYRMRDLGRSAAYLPLARATPDALGALRNAALVCIDELDAAAGDADWELELFALINQVLDRGAALLFASRGPVRKLGVELPDLRSRLAGAGAFALDPLPPARQLEVLQLRARTQGYVLDEKIVKYLSTRAQRNMKVLCELFDQIDVQAKRTRRKITYDFVGQILAGKEVQPLKR